MKITAKKTKRGVLVLFLLLITLPLFSGGYPQLADTWLIGTAWGPEFPRIGKPHSVQFLEDGTFRIWFVGMSRIQIVVTGSWKIEGDLLYVNRTAKAEGAGNKIMNSQTQKFAPLTYKLIRPETSFKLAYCLKLQENKKGLTFRDSVDSRSCMESIWMTEWYTLQNEERNVRGKEAICLEVKDARVTDNLRARSAPTTQAPYYEFADFGGPWEPVIPAGTTVKVYGRTTQKETIGEWTNYWYYVEYDYFERRLSGTGEFPPDSGQWVYGEFLQF